MTIRLTVSIEETLVTLLIEGHLTGADLPDVRAASKSVGAALRLDLSDLKSADDDAIHTLQSLSENGAELHGASPYISQLLREEDG